MKTAHCSRPLAWSGQALTLFRLASAPFLYRAIATGDAGVAAALLVAAMLSDLGDGALVRRFGRPSAAGAWFDIGADLAVILASYVALAPALGWLPTGAILASFVAFIATSRSRQPRYDPVGRYIGAILMPAALLAAVAPDALLQLWVVSIVVAACGLAVAGRMLPVARGRVARR